MWQDKFIFVTYFKYEEVYVRWDDAEVHLSKEEAEPLLQQALDKSARDYLDNKETYIFKKGAQLWALCCWDGGRLLAPAEQIIWYRNPWGSKPGKFHATKQGWRSLQRYLKDGSWSSPARLLRSTK